MGFTKLIFASPTYGPVDPHALKYQRAAIMFAASHGITWLGDASPDRMKFDVARDAVAKSACEMPDADDAAVFWCDSDIILPVHAIAQLAQYGLDFVTGIYFQRIPPHWPLIASFNKSVGSFQWIARWEQNVVAPIDGCGFGCVLTSVRLLKAIGQLWFNYEKFSEDFDFCLKAAKAGYPPHVDTGIVCGHLADPQPIGLKHFVSVHPEFFGTMAEEARKELESGSVRSCA
jgi:hypothetical protein